MRTKNTIKIYQKIDLKFKNFKRNLEIRFSQNGEKNAKKMSQKNMNKM